MTTEAIAIANAEPKPIPLRASKAPPTKASLVGKLLTRAKGATLADIAKATNWQPHSCRAFLTGLRKKGWAIQRGRKDDGTAVWSGRAPGAAEPDQL